MFRNPDLKIINQGRARVPLRPIWNSESTRNRKEWMHFPGFSLVTVPFSAPFQATWDVEFQVVSCPRTGRAGSEQNCGMRLKLDLAPQAQ